MKKNLVLVLLLNVSVLTSFGQKKLSAVLVFSKATPEYKQTNQAAIEMLFKTSLNHDFKIDTTTDASKIKEEYLKNYHLLVLLNTSVEALNYAQIIDFQRFMQVGGGFVGIHDIAEKSNNSVWYQHLLGGNLAQKQSEKATLSIITNASIGKTDVPPFWKIEDKPILAAQIATRCQPVLLDITGKTLAWHYTTEESGKMFYTALGAEPSVYENPDFMNHLWAGMEEVAAKKLPDFSKSSLSALPNEKYFSKQILTESLVFPRTLVALPNGNCLVFQQNGELKLYQNDKRKIVTIGKFDALGEVKKIKLDPDFSQNGFVYTFTGTNDYQVRRLQLLGDSTATLSDFTSTSTTPIAQGIKYNYSQFESKPYRLPKFYDGKTFLVDQTAGIKVVSFNENDELKTSEPFLANLQNHPNALEFGSDGSLLILEGNSLIKIDYSEKNRPPVAFISADVTEGKTPLKVMFSSTGSFHLDKDTALHFVWTFDEKNTSTDANPEFTFTKVGNYLVKLKVVDNQGLTDEKTLLVKAGHLLKNPVKAHKH